MGGFLTQLVGGLLTQLVGGFLTQLVGALLITLVGLLFTELVRGLLTHLRSRARPPALLRSSAHPPAPPAPHAPPARRHPIHPSDRPPSLRSPWRPSCGPGPPKSGFNSQSSDGHLDKRPSTYAVSCLKGTCTCGIRLSSRNAITSSYSSTGGISQVPSPGAVEEFWKRRGPSSSPSSGPSSFRLQTAERSPRKMRGEELSPHSGSSAPSIGDKQSQGEQGTTTPGKQNWDSPPTPSSSRLRRRRFPLVPSRRGIPLILPPAPVLCGPITREEYYREEQAQSEKWLKWIFQETASNSEGGDPPATPPSPPNVTLPAAETAAPAASLPAAVTDVLLRHLEQLADFLCLPSCPGCVPFPSGYKKDVTSLAVMRRRGLQIGSRAQRGAVSGRIFPKPQESQDQDPWEPDRKRRRIA
ncbi:nuclear envelope pore membrane protein POM 121-like isoform X1 [Manis javanica]|uniref:nuclear envelope pore membrane protein POM 121-like isoform X1 n=1 Tax=Manis javanica TaxID=9974 RepID=UPI003C6D7119